MTFNGGDRGVRWRTVAIGAVVLAVLVAGLTWVVVSRDGDDPPATAPAPGSPSPTSSVSPPTAGEAYDSACGLKGGSTQIPTSEPADIKWARIEGWAFPISASAGPGKRPAAGPWSCFARTPMGAVIAAYTIDLRLSFVSDFEAAVKQQVSPGVGRDALLAQGSERPEAITDTKGFIVESYTPDDAVISLYVVQQGESFTCSVEVQWRDGDWKLRALADGSTSSGCIRSAPPKYVPWGDD